MLKKILGIARKPSTLAAAAIFFLAGMVVWPQAQPPSMYDAKLISYNATPFGTCQVDQVALNVSNGAFYSCNPLTHTWVGTQAAALPMSITQGGFTHTLTGATTAPRTWTLQDASDTFVFRSTTDTLTNKTLDCTLNTLSKNPCVVYSTASASGNASISATTMATAGGSGNTYRFSAYTDQTVLGTSCASNTSVATQIIFTDPNTSSTTTATYTTMTIINNGTVGNTNSVFNNSNNAAMTFRAKASTVIQYQVTFTPGGSCSPAPSYQVYPILEQIQ